MKYAICNETFVDWPHEKAFATAREAGYTGIEIAPFTINADCRQISAEERQTIRQQAEAAGLEVVGLHWLLAKTSGLHLTTSDAAVRKTTAEYIQDLARLCHDLGGKIMVLGSPQQRNLEEGMIHDVALDNAAEVLAACTSVLDETGVTIAVEPLGRAEGDFLNTAALGIELCKRVSHDKIRLHLDVKAMSDEPTAVPDIIHASKDYLEHFHANDPNRLGPGMGDVDFVPIFQALKDVGYDGWVSVEVFDYSPGAEKIAVDSYNYMQECMAKLT